MRERAAEYEPAHTNNTRISIVNGIVKRRNVRSIAFAVPRPDETA
jgi:hypothetical protein